jgi:uncharacterized protein YuzE
MKTKINTPDDYGEFPHEGVVYDFDNRVNYDKESDSLYIYIAPPQGKVGCVLVYHDESSLISIDTDELNTQVGIEICGVTHILEKFNLNTKNSNN